MMKAITRHLSFPVFFLGCLSLLPSLIPIVTADTINLLPNRRWKLLQLPTSNFPPVG